MVIAARRHERRVLAVAKRHMKPKHIPVECNGPLKIGHFQMDVTDTGFGRCGIAHGRLLNLTQSRPAICGAKPLKPREKKQPPALGLR